MRSLQQAFLMMAASGVTGAAFAGAPTPVTQTLDLDIPAASDTETAIPIDLAGSAVPQF
jgi:hypothetical protein